MQIELNFKLAEMAPKKVLLSHIFRRMLTVTSSLRFYQMFLLQVDQKINHFFLVLIFCDAVTDHAALICIASHAWPGSLLKARCLYHE